MGDRPQPRDRAVDGEVPADEPVLDHRQHQRGRADLEVRRHLGEVGVAEDDVQPAVLLRVGVRLVARVDDRPLQRGLQPDLDLEVVGALADLEPVLAPVLADPDAAGAADHLSGHEERREVPHDLAERRAAPHQVVLVRAVGRALVVGVVLVEVHGRAAGQLRGPAGGVEHHLLTRLVPADDVQRRGHLGRGVLRVRVVDVEPGAVGEDHVRQSEVLVGQQARVGDLPRHVEAAGVAQRRLLLEVPARTAGPDRRGRVGVDDLGRGHHRVRQRLARDRDAVLDLGAHDAPHTHGSSVRGLRFVVTSAAHTNRPSRPLSDPALAQLGDQEEQDQDDDDDDQDDLHAVNLPGSAVGLGSPAWVCGPIVSCRGWPTGRCATRRSASCAPPPAPRCGARSSSSGSAAG